MTDTLPNFATPLTAASGFLDLNVRTRTSFRNDSIHTLGDLVEKTEPELLRARNFGRHSLNELKEWLLQQHPSLHLGMSREELVALGQASPTTEENDGGTATVEFLLTDTFPVKKFFEILGKIAQNGTREFRSLSIPVSDKHGILAGAMVTIMLRPQNLTERAENLSDGGKIDLLSLTVEVTLTNEKGGQIGSLGHLKYNLKKMTGTIAVEPNTRIA